MGRKSMNTIEMFDISSEKFRVFVQNIVRDRFYHGGKKEDGFFMDFSPVLSDDIFREVVKDFCDGKIPNKIESHIGVEVWASDRDVHIFPIGKEYGSPDYREIYLTIVERGPNKNKIMRAMIE